MRTADELETFSFNAHSDVIIARGYTACGLRKMTPELPIIELPITAYDLIRALNECITLYSPKKVAFIGNYTALSEADELGNFVNCDINESEFFISSRLALGMPAAKMMNLAANSEDVTKSR